MCSSDLGCLLAAVSTIESLAAQFPVQIALTGGDGKIIMQALSLNTEYHSNLVLDGLLINEIKWVDSKTI